MTEALIVLEEDLLGKDFGTTASFRLKMSFELRLTHFQKLHPFRIEIIQKPFGEEFPENDTVQEMIYRYEHGEYFKCQIVSNSMTSYKIH